MALDGARRRSRRQAEKLPVHTREPPLSARGAQTRRALVQAARRVFERDGFLDSRITDITAEAGVANGSFYTYFTSKEDAFSAVMEKVHEETLHPRLSELADRDDPLSVVEAANRAYLVAYRRNAKLMGLMEQVALINEDFRQIRLRRARSFAERNAASIRRLQERGLADPELDPMLAAQATGAMVSRMAYLTFVQGGDASLESLVQTLTRLWGNALRITPAAEMTKSST
jgi:AcrR family transcriptional regulator